MVHAARRPHRRLPPSASQPRLPQRCGIRDRTYRILIRHQLCLLAGRHPAARNAFALLQEPSREAHHRHFRQICRLGGQRHCPRREHDHFRLHAAELPHCPAAHDGGQRTMPRRRSGTRTPELPHRRMQRHIPRRAVCQRPFGQSDENDHLVRRRRHRVRSRA